MTDDRHTQTVSLGCGTLILIALIVLIFGGSDTDKLEREVRSLQTGITQLSGEVKSLQGMLEQQSTDLSALRRAVEELAAAQDR